jgi:cytochrome c551/c552
VSAAPTAAPAASAAPAAAPAAGPAWKDMSPAAKLEHMKSVVSPQMAKTFQGHDAKEFKEFGCKTCHGPNKESPKKFLPKLTFENGGFTSMKTKPAETKFMMEKVVPEMAKLMGEKPYDPQTHQGFGCGGCHVVDMKK